MGLVGESGIGKSTLLDWLVGLYEPVSGQILINNQAPTTYAEEQLMSQDVHLSQSNYLFAESIVNNLRLAKPDVSKAAMQRVLEAVGWSEVISRLPESLDSLVGEGGRAFSQGEK